MTTQQRAREHLRNEVNKHIAFTGLVGRDAEAYRFGADLGLSVTMQFLCEEELLKDKDH